VLREVIVNETVMVSKAKAPSKQQNGAATRKARLPLFGANSN
jgi:hypothetical protein